MRNIRLPLAVALILALLGGALSQGGTSLAILYTSEHHGQATPDSNGRGGFAARATYVNQVRAEVGADQVLLLDSGDLLVGTPLSTVFRGEPDVLAMNAMGYDAMSLGNHEFDFGNSRTLELMALANFPMMAANIVGATGFDPGSVVLERSGLKILVFGIINTDAPEISSPDPELLFLDGAQVTSAICQATSRGQFDLVIALTHQDNDDDVRLLDEASCVDVVIGGHVNGFAGLVQRGTAPGAVPADNAAGSDPVTVADPDGIFVRAPRLGFGVGRLDLTVVDGQMVSATQQNVAIVQEGVDNMGNPRPGLAPDPAVAAVLDPFVAQLSVALSQVVGRVDVNLDGERNNVRTTETNLGDLIADLQRQLTGADIGFANGGGIRASIPAGEVTLDQIIKVLPFGNTLVTFELTGTQVRAALENAVSQVENTAGRFLQVSGLRFTWDASQSPGSRVVEVLVGGQPLDDERIYTIATNDFLAGGGDGYQVFTEGQNLYNSQQLLADILADAIRAGAAIPLVEGRITRLN
ncbi:MAG: 5'-nucleotidase C-terminal domain-containing protein [Deinococcus sp.]|nr:5'-nucleotidase C-terminal domain-containing protein [Deinococcus sp.]